MGGSGGYDGGTFGVTSMRATSNESVRLALEVDISGAENFIIAAGDTVEWKLTEP